MVRFLGKGTVAAVLHPHFAFLPSFPTKFFIFSSLFASGAACVGRPRYETTVPPRDSHNLSDVKRMA